MIDYKSVITKLNEKDRKYNFDYSTNGVNHAIDYAGVEVFSTEYIDYEDYYDMTENQFVRYIKGLAKILLDDFIKEISIEVI